jgi:hypothetical protein
MSPPYNQTTVPAEALNRFKAWGGESRLLECLDSADIPLADWP